MSQGAAAFDLAPGETERRRWRISRWAFAARTAVLMLVTLAALSPLVFYTSWPGMVICALVLLPTYMWVMDDFRIWTDNARTTWLLTDRAVHIHAPAGDVFANLRLPLETIASVSRWPLWSLVLRLHSGVAIPLPLVPGPRRLQAEIRAALQER